MYKYCVSTKLKVAAGPPGLVRPGSSRAGLGLALPGEGRAFRRLAFCIRKYLCMFCLLLISGVGGSETNLEIVLFRVVRSRALVVRWTCTQKLIRSPFPFHYWPNQAFLLSSPAPTHLSICRCFSLTIFT